MKALAAPRVPPIALLVGKQLWTLGGNNPLAKLPIAIVVDGIEDSDASAPIMSMKVCHASLVGGRGKIVVNALLDVDGCGLVGVAVGKNPRDTMADLLRSLIAGGPVPGAASPQ